MIAGGIARRKLAARDDAVVPWLRTTFVAAPGVGVAMGILRSAVVEAPDSDNRPQPVEADLHA